MTTAFCPTCNQPVDGHSVLMDAARGKISYRGLDAHLTKHEFAIVAELVKAYPAALSKDRIFDILYNERFADADVPMPKIIDVFICKARKQLLGTGIIITTNWGRGYAITLADPELAEALKSAGVRARQKGGYRWQADDDDTLRSLVDRRLGVQQIASIMHAPYLAIQRAGTRLKLDIGGNQRRKAA